jgi:p24 family protein alpha
MSVRLFSSLLFLQSVLGLYFYVADSTPKCFIEEVPEDTLIVGTYKNPDFIPFGSSAFTGIGLVIEIKDPEHLVVQTRNADVEGKFAFTSQHGGEYLICIRTNSTKSFGGSRRFRFDLKLDVGEGGIDYKEVGKKEHLTQLELEIRRLNDKVKDIIHEQNYQKNREREFRSTSDTIHTRVQYLSIFQSLVMILAGLFQAWHLKNFFKSKKLV